MSLYDAASVTHKYFSVSLLVYTLRLSSRIRASSEMINSSKNVSLLKAEQGLETSEKEGIFLFWFYTSFESSVRENTMEMGRNETVGRHVQTKL